MNYIFKIAISLLLLLVNLFTNWETESCGITTHIVIGHRAATLYDQSLDDTINISSLLTKYNAAFQGYLVP